MAKSTTVVTQKPAVLRDHSGVARVRAVDILNSNVGRREIRSVARIVTGSGSFHKRVGASTFVQKAEKHEGHNGNRSPAKG